MTETENNTVRNRVQSKMRQTESSDFTSLPVYVIIVEFSEPYASMALKNVNS